MSYFNLIILVLAHIVASLEAQDLVVQLVNPNGRIQGHVLRSRNYEDFYAFQEIPYAAPPTGRNRFQLPQDHEGWDGIRQATRNSKVCIQFPLEQFTSLVPPTSHTVTEDCLYLNVYTPMKPGANNGSLLPVLVWIHGGAFVFGDGTADSYGPEFLIEHGIVIVTINYRLGPLGFLTTQDGIIPSNLGLKDQHFALKWVAQNIQLFGGNSSEVTLAALFRAAILQTGSSIGTYAYTNNSRHYAFELGRKLDKSFASNNSDDLLSVLLAASPNDIVQASKHVVNLEDQIGIVGDLIWTAVIENENDKDAFLTKPMYQSLLSGEFKSVPTLLGYNSQEVKIFAPLKLFKLRDEARKLDALDPASLVSIKMTMDDQNRSRVGASIKRTICSNSSFSEDLHCYLEFSSQITAKIPVIRQSEVSSKYSPVYLYQLSYNGYISNLLKASMSLVVHDVQGVAHMEDVYYLWNRGIFSRLVLFRQEALQTSLRMTKMWTNFVKYQNPTPEKDELLENIIWPVVEPDSIQYLDIDKSLQVRSNPENYRDITLAINKYIQPPFIAYF